ncbi:MAG TPA: hypothetical protein VNJ08_16160 [Bacteriovoracaceae bacterium]|nr:hypothetical protein [Bacteriovoracaceae bacterium]
MNTQLHLPYIKMPAEFISLLKSNLAVVTSTSTVFDVLRPNRALYRILEIAFQEFDDGRGLEKLLTALGWSNFRDRMASIYVYKSIFGEFPTKSNMDLVEDMKNLESTFINHGVNGYSRLFMLGFYIRLANIQQQAIIDGSAAEIRIPVEIGKLLNLSEGRTEKLDWLILIVIHLVASLGEKTVIDVISGGKKFNDLYPLMPVTDREHMYKNLLAYGASINEPDFFLYERV